MNEFTIIPVFGRALPCLTAANSANILAALMTAAPKRFYCREITAFASLTKQFPFVLNRFTFSGYHLQLPILKNSSNFV